jgi:hypothetical protein
LENLKWRGLKNGGAITRGNNHASLFLHSFHPTDLCTYQHPILLPILRNLHLSVYTIMNETSLTISSTHHLQPFILLSKSVKGAAHAKLIMDALDAPGVYVFSELYESPNVVQVRNNVDHVSLYSSLFFCTVVGQQKASGLPEVKPYYALLELFLYGTYGEYMGKCHTTCLL